MRLKDDEVRWLDEHGCRFPIMAWEHLERARQKLPLVQPSEDPSRHRKNTRRMEVVQDAALAIISAAAAVETNVLVQLLRVYNRLGDEDLERQVASRLVQDSGDIPIPEGREFRVKPAKELHELAKGIATDLGTTPQWPDNSYGIADERNRLVHRTVFRVASRPGTLEGLPLIRLMEDEGNDDDGVGPGVAGFVAKAAELFEVMFTCLQCCRSVSGTVDRDMQRVKEAVTRICDGSLSDRR